MCINYNLSENEITSLANFMGHADKIHLVHYRQPVIEKEILEISQYLEAAQGVDRDEDDNSDDSSDSRCSEFDINNNDINDDENEFEILEQTQNNEASNRIQINEINHVLQQNSLRDSNGTNASTEISYSDNDTENEENIRSVNKQIICKKKKAQATKRKVIPTNRTRWSSDEKRIVLDAFGYYLKKSDAKLPTFNQIGDLIKKHPRILKERNVATIKTWLHNQKRNLTFDKA